jgi:hypothetical protein
MLCLLTVFGSSFRLSSLSRLHPGMPDQKCKLCHKVQLSTKLNNSMTFKLKTLGKNWGKDNNLTYTDIVNIILIACYQRQADSID